MNNPTCPECGTELIYSMNGWHCATPAYADKRITALLFQMQLSAHMRRSKALVERARRESDDLAAGYAADVEDVDE